MKIRLTATQMIEHLNRELARGTILDISITEYQTHFKEHILHEIIEDVPPIPKVVGKVDTIPQTEDKVTVSPKVEETIPKPSDSSIPKTTEPYAPVVVERTIPKPPETGAIEVEATVTVEPTDASPAVTTTKKVKKKKKITHLKHKKHHKKEN